MTDSLHHQNDDLEASAMPPALVDPQSSSSPTPQNSSVRSGGRKKAIAAVLAIMLAAAVVAGVAASVTGRRTGTSLEESSAAVVVVVEGEGDDGTAQEMEDMDIIDDRGYGGDCDEEDDIDQYADQRPEDEDVVVTSTETGEDVVEDKVPIDDVDSIEVSDFDGPVTDFIYTSDISRIDSPTTNGACANSGEVLWNMQLITDNYPWETAYTVRDADGGVIMAGPPQGNNYERSKKYVGSICVPTGDYVLEVTDSGEDGMCCEYGNGSMVVKVNGETVATTPKTDFSSFKRIITVDDDGTVTQATEEVPITTAQLHSVDIKVKTDGYGSETGYKFEKVNGNVLFNKAVGSLAKNTLYKNNVLIAPGQYRLTLTDNFNGLENGGYFSVSIDGEEVVYGDKWNTQQSKTLTYTIRPGYKPTMTTRDEAWLTAHNTRRKAYHEAQGKTYRPLVWSPELAEASSDWVDEILPTCSIIRETGVVEGENMSTRKSSMARNEGPEVLLGRWSDKPLNNALGYPANQSMTQVMWRATRYVGCNDKMIKAADGTYCYVSICRYARAGNCAMSQYSSWKVGTLADRTKCGPACTSNGCY